MGMYNKLPSWQSILEYSGANIRKNLNKYGMINTTITRGKKREQRTKMRFISENSVLDVQ